MFGIRYGTASPSTSSESPTCSKVSLFMKWYMSPSWYRYSISDSSRIARSTMSTERKR